MRSLTVDRKSPPMSALICSMVRTSSPFGSAFNPRYSPVQKIDAISSNFISPPPKNRTIQALEEQPPVTAVVRNHPRAPLLRLVSCGNAHMYYVRFQDTSVGCRSRPLFSDHRFYSESADPSGNHELVIQEFILLHSVRRPD